MKRNGLRTVVVLALTIFLLNAPVCATASRLQDTCAEARDEVALRPEWMRILHDTLPICKISIPGSHDSGSIKGGHMLKTQATDIPAQLRQGIRAFDIRLEKKGNKLGVFHSHAFQDIYWEDDVLPAFIHFLQTYPSETLIVSLKKEGGELRDYASLLSVSLSSPEYQSYFVMDFRPELTLKDCRGKILFLHRDHAMDNYPGAACVGWEDDSTCLLTLRNKDGKEGVALLEDEYQYESGEEAGKKVGVCVRNIEGMSAEPVSSRRWGITFVSATGLPLGTPKVFADKVNKPIADYLKQKNSRNCGIVFIDFVSEPGGKDLVEYLIGSNVCANEDLYAQLGILKKSIFLILHMLNTLMLYTMKLSIDLGGTNIRIAQVEKGTA